MPGEDDSEETGHIHFDQLWESQLQYVISVAGKSFPIGGLMPIRFTLRPLAKIKIYRITVLLEGTHSFLRLIRLCHIFTVVR